VSLPFIEVDGLTIRYGNLLAVNNVSFRADSGEITAILGPNGAGKTSVIQACTGLRRPTGGVVRLLGSSPQDARVRDRIGVMLQSGGLYPTARPLEWLTYLARLYPCSLDPATVLERLGLDPTMRTPTRRLSGGQAQRVKLAAALVHQPEVLFLDEPSAGLDPLGRQGLLDLIREQRAQGRSIVLSTHLLTDVEDLADRILVLAAGRIHASGSIAELTEAEAAVRFAGPPGLDFGGLAAMLPVGYRVLEPTPGTYVVDGPVRPEIMSTVGAWCAQHGALTAGIRPGRHSLEDIVRMASQVPGARGGLE